MQINLHNYEQFLVDYADGTLPKELVTKVEAFLLTHPEIQVELDAFADMNMELSELAFNDKNSLKSIPLKNTSLNSDEFNKLCVGHIENSNSKSEDNFLMQLIAEDKKKKNILLQYEKTILNAEHFVFDEKLLTKKDPLHHKISQSNFTEYCIAASEGWLNSKGHEALNAYISNDEEKLKQKELIHNLKLKADHSIVFEGKSKLKRLRFINTKNKKRLAYASSIAAMFVFSILFYNSNQINNHKALSSAITPSSITVPKTRDLNKIEEIPAEVKEIQKPLYKDPLRITEVTFDETILDKKAIKSESLQTIRPIQLNNIECPKCIAYNETSTFFKYEVKNTSLPYSSPKSFEASKQTNNDIAWKIAQAGITGINMLTNADMALKKESSNEKTRIAFNSKLISFSAPVKKKSNF